VKSEQWQGQKRKGVVVMAEEATIELLQYIARVEDNFDR